MLEEKTDNIAFVLRILLVIFACGIMSLQAFNMLFGYIGKELQVASQQAQFVATVPCVVLGISCFLWGSLSDYISTYRFIFVNALLILAGSFIAFFMRTSILALVIGRSLQTLGMQAAGTAYLVISARYLSEHERIRFFGIYTGVFQGATALGMIISGLFTNSFWPILLLLPAGTAVFIPFLRRSMPRRNDTTPQFDMLGLLLVIISASLFLAFFSCYIPQVLLFALAFSALFIVHIHRAKHPIIHPSLFHNSQWIFMTIIVVIFYFFNYVPGPALGAIAEHVYHLPNYDVSLALMLIYLVVMGASLISGRIIEEVSRRYQIIFAALLMIFGLLLISACINVSFFICSVAVAFVLIGFVMLYPVVLDMLLETSPHETSGNIIGVNDLIINTAASLGLSLCAVSFAETSDLSVSWVFHILGSGANISNVFFGLAILCTTGLILFMLGFKLFGFKDELFEDADI